MKKLAVLITAAIIACFTLTACGGSDFEGKWECKSMSMGGKTIEDNFMGIPLGAMFQMEINSDGTGVLKSGMGDDGEDEDSGPQEFTWKEKDGKLVLTAKNEDGKDEDIELEYEDEELTMEMEGETVVFGKVDKFTEFDASQFSLGGDDEE